MPVRASSKIQSAGLLLFVKWKSTFKSCLGTRAARFGVVRIRVPGPFRKADWAGKSPLSAAQREFAEETGYRPGREVIPLGSAKQPGGKIVHVWAIEEDWDPANLQSNTFEMEWPPRSGQRQSFPEIDRASWFGIAEARLKILKGQAVFLDQLLETLGRVEGG